MIERKAYSLLIALLFTVIVGVSTANASSDCSLATLKGNYVNAEEGSWLIQLEGFPPPPYPFVAIGSTTFDGNGNWSGATTLSIDGLILSGSALTGTYDVKSDCTLTMEFTLSGFSPTFETAGTISGNGLFQEVHYQYTDGQLFASPTLKKVSPGICSVASLQGTYALFGHGAIVLPIPGFSPIPVSQTGIVTFDGAGGFSGQDTAITGGVLDVAAPFTGTYEVNPECKVSVIVNTIVGPIHEEGFLTGEGEFREFHGIFTEQAWVFTQTLRKQ